MATKEAWPTNREHSTEDREYSLKDKIRDQTVRVPKLKLSGLRKSGQVSATTRDPLITPPWHTQRSSATAVQRSISVSASKFQNQVCLAAVGVISSDGPPHKAFTSTTPTDSTGSAIRPSTAPKILSPVHARLSFSAVDKELTLDNWPCTISQGSRTWIRTLEQELKSRLAK